MVTIGALLFVLGFVLGACAGGLLVCSIFEDD